jgi:cysteine-rich repeat protein
MVVNPGTCTESRTTGNYDNLRAFVINLRNMEVERCIDLSLTGCGDGRVSSRNDEKCDDGNVENGDGCSSSC